MGVQRVPTPNLMKYTTWLNLGVEKGYRVIQTSTTTWIARKTNELVNQTMLIMFAVVLIHECEYWEIVLHWSLPMTCFRGFPRIGPVRISLLVPVILRSRFAGRAFLSASFIGLKFKSALPLVLVSQRCIPHAGLPACL